MIRARQHQRFRDMLQGADVLEIQRIGIRLLATILGIFLASTLVVGRVQPPRDIALRADTLLVMGGSTNGSGLRMKEELSGCHLSDCSQWRGYVSGAPGTQYAGYDYQLVTWPGAAPFGTDADGLTFDESRAEGLRRFETALAQNSKPGVKIVGVGISGSANVLSNELRKLQAARDAGESAPSPDDLSFVLIGNPNRPNGGLFARFPGWEYQGTTLDGAMPVTDYSVTDISWQWDPVSDFPTYPLNLLALANTTIGYLTLHSVYFPADPTDESTIVQDVTVGNTRYLLLHPDHLPLLAPLHLLGVPTPVIRLVQAPLEYLVELGYDRTISPGTPTPAHWIPPLLNPIDVTIGFARAVGRGIDEFGDSFAPQVAADTSAVSIASKTGETGAGGTGPFESNIHLAEAGSAKPGRVSAEPELRDDPEFVNDTAAEVVSADAAEAGEAKSARKLLRLGRDMRKIFDYDTANGVPGQKVLRARSTGAEAAAVGIKHSTRARSEGRHQSVESE